MLTLQFKVEKSQSKTKKHVLYSTVYVFKKRGGLLHYTQVKFSEQPAKTMYSRGEAKLVTIEMEHGDFAVYAWFVRNFRNRVKGYISIYGSRGELLYRAKYLNGYVVRSKGNPLYAWLVRLFLDLHKIPVVATKLGDEK